MTKPVPTLAPSGFPDPVSFDCLIDEAIAYHTFTGIACGLWVDGKEKFVRFAGHTADPRLDPKDCEPVTKATLFDSASLTKPLATSFLALKALEAGALDFDESLGHYLPEANPKASAIPLRALLSHTSGLPAIPAIESHFPSAHSLNRATAISRLLSIEPERAYGEWVNYSCTGYMLLGLVLERASGLSIGELYKREISEPLGLPEARFSPGIGAMGEPLPLKGAAATEYCPWRGARMRGLVHDESAYCLGGQAGNAGLFVCLDDVFLSASLLLQGGYANGKQFFLESSLAKLMTNKTEGLEERRSLGFRLHDSSTFEGPLWPSSSFGHTGFTGTSLAISPEQRMVSVILSNRVYYGRAETAQKMSDFRIRFHAKAFREFCR